ncbi:MAG: hypothetical protein LBV31_03205 [Prevotellaceae bacterium]|jgi:hypothetical protein|nr:hypothetical protein [Prevotellaceae bacterium]
METAVLKKKSIYRGTSVIASKKVKFIEGFTPQQRAEFDNGISIEDYAREKGIIIL